MGKQPHFIPNTPAMEAEMLAAAGVESFQELLAAIPAELQQPFPMPVGESQPEMEVVRHLQTLAGRNTHTGSHISFLGGGAYDHFIPSAIPALIARSEFYTAYTPYQAEVSQGTLQAMYEYQSLICQISALEVSNASLYDGASAVAEGCLMAGNATRRRKILLSAGLFPNYREVVSTYLQYSGLELETIPLCEGVTDLGTVNSSSLDDTAALVIQSPNRLGMIEDWPAAGRLCREHPAFFLAVGDPLALGMFAAPGECGADIYAAEGQVCGNALSLGGPYLGIFATRREHIRRMPGRLAGATTDSDGRPGYVLTLQTREQHIRRERATSNICTNQGLMALSTAIYLSLIGKQGFRKIAELCFQKAHYCAGRIARLPGYELPYGDRFFKEFVVRCPRPTTEIITAGMSRGLFPGTTVPEDPAYLRIAVTEKRTRRELDRLVDFLGAL